MANFPRVKPAGWGAQVVLESALMNQLDVDHSKAINGDDGSTHAPATQIVLAGAGVKFQGPIAFDTGSAPHVNTGVTLTVDSGATCALAAGSATTCLGLMQATPTAGSYLDLSGDITNVLKCGGVTTLNELHVGETFATGPIQRTAAASRAPHRFHALATTTPIAVDTSFDVYRVASDLSAHGNQTLNVGAGLEAGDWMIFTRQPSASAHTVAMAFGGALGTLTAGSSLNFFLHVAWTGSEWIPVAASPSFSLFS